MIRIFLYGGLFHAFQIERVLGKLYGNPWNLDSVFDGAYLLGFSTVTDYFAIS